MRELTPEELAWRCPDGWIPWESSAEIKAAETIVGQDRAVRAIAFGLGVRGTGYNVFVTGLSGTGRLTTIKRFLDGRTKGGDRPDDVCFVYNFDRPEKPNAVFLAAGAGKRLRDGMERMVNELEESLPAVLKDQAVRQRLERAVGELQERERALVSEFEKEVEEAGFGLVQIQMGPVSRPEVLPVVDGEPVGLEELDGLVRAEKLTAEKAEELRAVHETLASRLHEVFEGVSELREKAQHRANEVRREIFRPVLDAAVRQVRRAVQDRRAADYLKGVREDLEENLELFGAEAPEGIDRFLRWRVNLVVDNEQGSEVPVIMETEPTVTNLFGTVERSLSASGESSTSFMRIRAGSLMAANGGFLVLNAEDLLLDARVWPVLKRALKYGRVKIQSPESQFLGVATLDPEPVPLDVKVVVIGDRPVYDMLYRWDKDFSKVFKVLADFDLVIPVEEQRAHEILSVFTKVIQEEGLLALNRSGMACLLEHAVRMSRGRGKFSSRFSDLSDVVREASWTAREAGAEAVGREHVDQARAAARERHSLSEDRLHELVEQGVIRINTDGEAVGRLNGLAVFDLGHHRFGRPSKISARVGLGREGVINIERHAGLSGPTHDKGVQILSGFLRGTFARRAPLSIACSVTFEQSYGGIDGDSASSTEIYAIVSALSELPLRQDVAVTGSVDQYGQIQSIGGVNEKIEGFFRVCQARGLTGSQGVMIPATDVGDLHLRESVVQAVRDGLFHVWAVTTVEEGIELLTGVSAGEDDGEGSWTEGSVYRMCQDRVEEMARLLRAAGKPKDETAEDNGEETQEEETPTPGDEPEGDDPNDDEPKDDDPEKEELPD
jgi:ATP-dependent Lon protease